MMNKPVRFCKIVCAQAALVTVMVCFSSSVIAQTIGEVGKPQVTVIKPKKEPAEVKSAKIDDEKFELGAHFGLLSLADLNTVSVVGFSASYHINERWLASLAYGKSGAPRAQFEEVDGRDFVVNRDAGFQYLAAIGSYEVIEGRSFFGKNKKFNSHIYLDFGLENVDFMGESQVGAVLGVNYKLVFTDWLTGNLMFRDHIVDRTFLGESKLTQNIEMAFGFSALF
jgi:outer membrane beta-barrel protein